MGNTEKIKLFNRISPLCMGNDSTIKTVTEIKQVGYSISLTPDLLFTWHSPLVYVAIGREGVLYIGMSGKGLSRVFSESHHALSRIRDQIIGLEILPVETEVEAFALEKSLICKYSPTYNSASNAPKRQTMPKRRRDKSRRSKLESDYEYLRANVL